MTSWVPYSAQPLLLATGVGAESRSTIGAVVVYGVTFSMLLTLIVVPAVYVLIAKNTHSPEYVAQMIENLRKKTGLAKPETESTQKA